MSNLNIYKSKSSTDLSSTDTTPLEDGAVYFTNDTHEIYADLNGAREAYGGGGGGSALDKQQIEKNKQDILTKVSSNGGDVSDTVINTIEEETTQKFPIISPKDTIKKAIGKLKKWQTDMVADMGNYVLKSMISNQQINDQNKVPSSALAYTMNQQISKLNEEFKVKDAQISLKVSGNDNIQINIQEFIPSGYKIASIIVIGEDRVIATLKIITETPYVLIRNLTNSLIQETIHCRFIITKMS